jgi:hypothetical protein
MNMKAYRPSERHLALMNDLKIALLPYRDMPVEHVLALVSQLVGNLTAIQDQTVYTSEQVMTIVAENIKLGNHTAINNAFPHTGPMQ